MTNPENCRKCEKYKTCKSWYGGSGCTEVENSMYNAVRQPPKKKRRQNE